MLALAALLVVALAVSAWTALRPGRALVRRWLMPGIGIKRWLVVVFAGLLLLALAGAHAIRQITRDLQPGGAAQIVIDAVTLQFLPYPFAADREPWDSRSSVSAPTAACERSWSRSGHGRPATARRADLQKRFLARGPRVVAIGGGTGLSTLLRGLKEHTSNLTAIVTVADDGGSSGVLRADLGIPAVGDIRNCIAALADAEPLMSEVLQYRFGGERSQAALADAGPARSPGMRSGTCSSRP
jgi:hypothetical protein